MKKRLTGRIIISVIMHLLIGAAFVIIANLLLHPDFKVSFLEGDESFIPNNAFSEDYVFEDSDIYTVIYTRQIQDIITYSAIRNVIEKGEEQNFDSVNILDFAYSNSSTENKSSQVVYYIDDLIKWGRTGFTYDYTEYTVEEFLGKYESDLALDYILDYCSEKISSYTDEEGNTLISVVSLHPIYSTVSGVYDLSTLAGDWVDFYNIEDSLVYAAEKYSKYYDLYKVGNGLYESKDINLKYILRVGEGDEQITYSNISDSHFSAIETSDEELTNIISDYRDYIVYFPDRLEYQTLSDVNESELYIYVRSYADEFRGPMRLWSYIEGDFNKQGDAFSIAFEATSGRKSMLLKSIISGSLISLLYLGLFIYMSVTAGRFPNGTKYLYKIDKVFIEIYGSLFLGCVLLSRYLFNINSEERLGNIPGYFIPMGIITSFTFVLFIYSLIRRIRNGCLSQYSLIYFIYRSYGSLRDRIENSRNPYVSALIPFHFYFIINFVIFVLIVISANNSNYAGLFFFITILIVLNILFAIRKVKKDSDMNSIREGLGRLSAGDLEYKIDKDSLLTKNKELADEINHIGEGIKNAVNTSMKDEKMKSDLITNVSHDLKTPLTSIINYVNLLQDENITQEPAAGYIKTLDDKSRRLKQLLIDLIDASRLSSGTTEVDLSVLKITELLHQIIAEFSDKLENAGLEPVFDGESGAYILADGRHMWRLMDNLFENVCKYSLKGTRVYISVKELEGSNNGKILISIKNVSARPNTLQGNELTEKFIRGDASRSTEGSGLGLYIAKSLTELQKGTFEVIADGDLFKVDITFDILRKD
ncbi:MAG: HAMP domain-containing histidine kinase [Lachnospiraceae bacterium]|nr:HAMP domain-containing histidine kinase [Lachnospiraceae bacterium]